MRRTRGEKGYALLAALLITALAAVFASACVAAVSARQHVTRADHAGAAADEALRQVISQACLDLWRFPSRRSWTASGQSPTLDLATWEARCSPAAPTAEATWPLVQLDVQVTTPAAARHLAATIELQAEPQAQGVVVAHDLEARAPVGITGGGLYCGGSVRGREWISFGDAEGASASASAVDDVHGDLWPSAAAHALGGLWAAGQEIHASGPPEARYASDTDAHTGSGAVAALTQEPDLATLAALAEVGVPPAGALVDGVLDLARLPLSSPAAGGSGTGTEPFVVVVPPQGQTGIVVVGARSPGACPLVLVLEGDAVLGRFGDETRLEGAVIACRSLDVSGPASLTGHLFTANMTVTAPLNVTTPPDWRMQPLPGLVHPVIVAVGR